ncbi:MAG: GNAT family N-acetyltransferase [Candidatus Hodarchaeales archaeon]
MEIRIRNYSTSDFNEIKDIILHGENFGEPFLETEIQRINNYQQLPHLGRILVVEEIESNKVVGFVALEFRWKSIVIQVIITHHDHLRQGIGRKMIKEAIKIGEEHPMINVLRVDTGDFMEYAQRFYLACGFQFSGYVAHDLSWNNHQVHFAYPLKGIEEMGD